MSTRILKLLNKDISNQLVFLFGISFSFCFFLSILKTGKIKTIYKKPKKKKKRFSGYRSFSLLSNIEKFWEDFCLTELIFSWIRRTRMFYTNWFLTKNSTAHALIDLTIKIRKEIDKCNYAYGVSVQTFKMLLIL